VCAPPSLKEERVKMKILGFDACFLAFKFKRSTEAEPLIQNGSKYFVW
jgi:hypothetical protein